MDNSSINIGIVINDDETSYISFTDVCKIIPVIEKDNLIDMLEHGLIPSITNLNDDLQFNSIMMRRIVSAFRLQTDLGLNPAGVVLALELLDSLDELNQQLAILKKHRDL
jgi:chaperone modulatory protein CbpM